MIDEKLTMLCEGVYETMDPNLTPDEIARINGLCDYLLGESLPCAIVDESNAERYPKNRPITRNMLKIMVLEALEFGREFKTKPTMEKVDNVLRTVLHGDDPTGKSARTGARLQAFPEDGSRDQ